MRDNMLKVKMLIVEMTALIFDTIKYRIPTLSSNDWPTSLWLHKHSVFHFVLKWAYHHGASVFCVASHHRAWQYPIAIQINHIQLSNTPDTWCTQLCKMHSLVISTFDFDKFTDNFELNLISISCIAIDEISDQNFIIVSWSWSPSITG